MKKMKSLLVLSVIFAVLVSLASCTELHESLDNEDIRADTEAMIDSILENDLDSAYTLISDVCSKQEFASIFSQIREIIGNESEYKLSPIRIYYNTSVNDGQKVESVSATYKMECGEKDYIIDVKSDSLHKELAMFYLTPYENSAYYQTGAVNSMREANIVQWILLLSNLISIAVCIWALIDCSRRSIKKKWLIITMIILGFMSIGASIASGSIRFNWSFLSFGKYTALILYGNGALDLRLMLPAGAILYFIIRKRLTKPSEKIPENTEVLSDSEQANEASSDLQTNDSPSDDTM